MLFSATLSQLSFFGESDWNSHDWYQKVKNKKSKKQHGARTRANSRTFGSWDSETESRPIWHRTEGAWRSLILKVDNTYVFRQAFTQKVDGHVVCVCVSVVCVCVCGVCVCGWCVCIWVSCACLAHWVLAVRKDLRYIRSISIVTGLAESRALNGLET